jgi:low molecular weight phosphotyrosine protein phosphatase
VEPHHFDDFDYLIGMDSNNVRNLKSIQPRGSRAQIKLFGEYGDGKAIEDPYYGGKQGFETTYKQVLAYSEALLESLNLDKSAD